MKKIKKQTIKKKRKTSLIPFLRLRLQVYDKEAILLFEKALYDFFLDMVKKGHSMDSSSINLPMTKKKITVLRSPHVNKKAKDQFEIRLYNKIYAISIFLKKKNTPEESLEFLILLKNLTDFFSRYSKTAKKVSFKIFVESGGEFKKIIS